MAYVLLPHPIRPFSLEAPDPGPPDPRTPLRWHGIIRPRGLGDLEGIQSLLRRLYRPPHGAEAVWSQESLLRHLARFPEGQVVAEDETGRIVGTATCMRVSMGSALIPHTWLGITGGGGLPNHDPQGDVLYGVNIAVDRGLQGRGIGRALYDARLRLGRSLGCRAFFAGARIPGYRRFADRLTPEAYVDGVVRGTCFDPTLSKQLRIGFRVLGILENYAPDPETLGHAALIAMELQRPGMEAGEGGR